MVNNKLLMDLWMNQEDCAKKIDLLVKEGYQFDRIEELDNIYIGKPTGFTKFNIIIFKKDDLERQLCVYKKDNKTELFKGSLSALLRTSKEYQKRNKIFVYMILMPYVIDMIASKTSIIDGVNLRTIFYSHSVQKTDIFKTFDIIVNNLPIQEIDTFDGPLNIREFLTSEFNTKKSNIFEGGNIDRAFYVKNTFIYAYNKTLHTCFLNDDFENYKKRVADLPGKNISSVLSLSTLQKEFITFVAKYGTSKDLQDIILSDTANGQFKLNIASCDALLEAIKISDYKVKNNLIYAKLSPIFSQLYNANGIGKGFKQRISVLLAQTLINTNIQIKDISKILNLNITNKPTAIEKYLTACINNEDPNLILAEYYTPKKDENKINKITVMMSTFSKKIDEKLSDYSPVLIAMLDNEFGENLWKIEEKKLTIKAYNEYLREHSYMEYIVPEISNILDEALKVREANAIKIAQSIVTQKKYKTFKKGAYEIAMENDIPVVKFTSYNIKNFDNKETTKLIKFSDNQLNNIKEDNSFSFDETKIFVFSKDTIKNFISNITM